MAALAVGSWVLPTVPEGWEPIAQHGARRAATDVFPSNASFVEEPLPADKQLAEYLEDQLAILRHFLPDVQVAGPRATSFADADEARELMLRYTAADGRRIIQAQFYVRAGGIVGVLTLTTIEEEVAKVKAAFDLIRQSARFRPAPPQQPLSTDKVAP